MPGREVKGVLAFIYAIRAGIQSQSGSSASGNHQPEVIIKKYRDGRPSVRIWTGCSQADIDRLASLSEALQALQKDLERARQETGYAKFEKWLDEALQFYDNVEQIENPENFFNRINTIIVPYVQRKIRELSNGREIDNQEYGAIVKNFSEGHFNQGNFEDFVDWLILAQSCLQSEIYNSLFRTYHANIKKYLPHLSPEVKALQDKVGNYKALLEFSESVKEVSQSIGFTKTTSLSEGIIYFDLTCTPVELEDFLLKHSVSYSGYRDSNSLFNLENPSFEAFSEGVICLFPALELKQDKVVIMRSAGCNTSELIAAQLAYYWQKAFEPELKLTHEEAHGHHSSPYLQRVMDVHFSHIFAALGRCIGIKKGDFFNHESEDGDRVITDEALQNGGCYIRPMEERSLIYRAFSPNPLSDLAHLVSVEIPVEKFLDALLEVAQTRESMAAAVKQLQRAIGERNANQRFRPG